MVVAIDVESNNMASKKNLLIGKVLPLKSPFIDNSPKVTKIKPNHEGNQLLIYDTVNCSINDGTNLQSSTNGLENEENVFAKRLINQTDVATGDFSQLGFTNSLMVLTDDPKQQGTNNHENRASGGYTGGTKQKHQFNLNYHIAKGLDDNNDDTESDQMNSSLIKCCIKEMENHIINANYLLKELEVILERDSHLNTIPNTCTESKKKNDSLENINEQAKLLREWSKNRKEFHKLINLARVPQDLNKDQNTITSTPNLDLNLNLTNELKTKRSRRQNRNKQKKPQLIQFWSLNTKAKIQAKPKKLTLTKPNCVKTFAKINNSKLSKSSTPVEVPTTIKTNFPFLKTSIKSSKVGNILSRQNTGPIIIPYYAQHNKPPVVPSLSEWATYLCPNCSKHFNLKSQWRRHIECVHLNLFKFKCNKCGKQFKRSDHLKNHSKRIHMLE